MKNWEYIKVGNGSGAWRGKFYEDSAGNSASVEKRGEGWQVYWEDARGYGKPLGTYKDERTAREVAEDAVESEMPDKIRAKYKSNAINKKLGNESIDKQEWSMFSGLKKDAEKEIGNSNYRYKGYLITKSDEDGEIIVYKPNGRDVAFRGTKSESIAKDWVDHHEVGNKKVGNRESLVGKYVWVRDKGDEWKCYVLQDHGNKLYIQDTDGHLGWVSIERVTGVVKNKKTGNYDAQEKLGLKPVQGEIEKEVYSVYTQTGKDKEKTKKALKSKHPHLDEQWLDKLLSKLVGNESVDNLKRARNAMNKKVKNEQITLWKGNDTVLISEDGTVQYLESNSFEVDRDKYDSQKTAIEEMTKQGYRKK